MPTDEASLHTDPGTDHPIVLFDGECGLCSRSVQFILKRDPHGRFHFAPLQSAFAQELLREREVTLELESVVLIDGRRAFTRSTAALQIARGLRSPWPILGLMLAVPRPIRDGVYRLIARNRYRLFGRVDSCRLLAPEQRDRFLA